MLKKSLHLEKELQKQKQKENAQLNYVEYNFTLNNEPQKTTNKLFYRV